MVAILLNLSAPNNPRSSDLNIVISGLASSPFPFKKWVTQASEYQEPELTGKQGVLQWGEVQGPALSHFLCPFSLYTLRLGWTSQPPEVCPRKPVLCGGLAQVAWLA